MSWPPGPPTEQGIGFLDFGVTTIVWGTEGFSQGSLGGYIIKTVRPSQRVEELRIENGTGLTATEILLIDGVDYEITVVDDTRFSIPFAGEILVLATPFPFDPGPTTSTPDQFVILVNNSYNAARKQEGERVLLCRSFHLIDLSS